MERRATDCGTELAADAFVFSASPDGAFHWWPSNLDSTFRRLCRLLGLPDSVKLHGLRHTQVTQLLDAGVPLCTVSGRGRPPELIDDLEHLQPLDRRN